MTHDSSSHRLLPIARQAADLPQISVLQRATEAGVERGRAGPPQSSPGFSTLERWALGKFHAFSVPEFPHVSNGYSKARFTDSHKD